MISIAGLIAGIVILIGGGAVMVRGASELATKLGVSPLIVGLTVVGFGTSAPELIVNVIGAFRGETGLAFGNVVGSNISNLALILGAAALFAPINIQGQLVRREVPLLLLATAVITVMALDGPFEGLPAIISRSEAVVLLLLFCIFIYVNALDVLPTRRSDALLVHIEESPLIVTQRNGRHQWLLIVGGMALLFVGGELTIRNGVSIAASLGISPTLVGLFMISIGTSMPELVTSIIAAFRKESDLALGNVVGSNIFNSLIVLPVTGLITQIAVPRGGMIDLVVSLSLAAMLIPIFYFGKARLGRMTGTLLLLFYMGYAGTRIWYDGASI